MTARQLRRRCESLVRRLRIGDPFDLRRFCRELGLARGREIVLLPMALPDAAPCGLWLAGEHADYIVYEERTSPVHQRHIVLHEIGHLLCGHAGPTPPDDDLRVFPSLSQQTVHHILSRTSYNTEEEQEAELIASLILQRADRSGAAAAPDLTGSDADVIARLSAALARPGRRHGD